MRPTESTNRSIQRDGSNARPIHIPRGLPKVTPNRILAVALILTLSVAITLIVSENISPVTDYGPSTGSTLSQRIVVALSIVALTGIWLVVTVYRYFWIRPGPNRGV